MPTPFLSSEEYDERAHALYNEGKYDEALGTLREGLTFANGNDAPTDCELASFTTVDLSTRWNARSIFSKANSIRCANF